MRVLLLDLDDTLLDYSGGVEECWSAACAAVTASAGLDQVALVAAIRDVARWFWSDPERHRRERTQMVRAWATIAATALERVGAGRDGLGHAIAVEFAARRRAMQRLFPEALEVLERLRAGGVRLGMVTNGDATMQRDKIERHDLARFFDVLVIEGEFGAGKPDARVYRHALEGLGARAEDAWMVGDHLEFDVAGAQRLGIAGAWLDRAGEGLPPGSPVRPDRILRSLRELTDGA